MRWLLFITVAAAAGCAPSAYVEEAEAPVERPQVIQRSVKRWMIATTGDQPPSCDERLEAEGLGPDEAPLGIPLEIVHLNEMTAMRLMALSYTVDGQCSFSWSHDGGYRHSAPNQLNIIRTQLEGGEHEVGLVAEYGPHTPTPHGYDYRIKVRGVYVIDLDSATRLFVTNYEKGDANTPVEKRPAMRFELGELASPPVLRR
jgi:hypothetical protein